MSYLTEFILLINNYLWVSLSNNILISYTFLTNKQTNKQMIKINNYLSVSLFFI